MVMFRIKKGKIIIPWIIYFHILSLLIFSFSIMIINITNAESNDSPLKYQCGDFYYVISNSGEAILTYYSGGEQDLTLPSELDGYPLTEIRTYAFDKDCLVNHLTIPGNIKKIDREAFFQCISLSEVILEEGVTIIEEAAFTECYSLLSISIPKSVSSIYGNPFVCCNQLEKIIVQDNNPTFSNVCGVLFDKINKRLVSFPGGLKVNDYVIPEGIKEISQYAFSFHNYLTSVSMPDGLEKIGDYAFQFCKITEISLPDSVLEIGEGAFTECYSLKSVETSKKLLLINNWAFSCCPELKTLNLPESICVIGNDFVFDDDTITLVLYPGSYAEKYCIEKGYSYVYLDLNP